MTHKDSEDPVFQKKGKTRKIFSSTLESRLLFLALPVVFLMIVLLIHFSYGPFFMHHIDPEYFHLYSGICLSRLSLSVEYIAHPGTTLQILFAISARIVDLLQPTSDLITNLISNPEQYIHGTNILLNIINAFVLFFLGFYTYRCSGNYGYAFLLQLIPFSSHYLLTVSARLIAESVELVPVILMIMLTVKYIYDSSRDKNMNFYSIAFAVISGLGIAGKISFFPFVLLPLVLISEKKYRIRFLLYTALAVAVFAFPLVVHLHKSREWFGNMFTHSGKWGGGSKSFINLSQAPDRIKSLYLYVDKQFFVISGLATLQYLIFLIIPSLRKNSSGRVILRVFTGLILSVLLYVFLVLKHFAFYYLFPALAVKVFFLYLMTELLVRVIRDKRMKRWLPALTLIVALVLVVPQVRTLKKRMSDIAVAERNSEEKYYTLKTYFSPDTTVIISSAYYGSPFISWAHVNAFNITGKLRNAFTPALKKKFPSTYFYFPWTDKFFFWGDYLKSQQLVDGKKTIYVYIGEGKEGDMDAIMKRLKEEMPETEFQKVLLHKFENPAEYFYRIKLSVKNGGFPTDQ
ncbi:MAG TPA: hypothetical protein ENK25_08125 [Bacteroidetes bacterium]|nr:hypothetical protein [Bacteroidota bacterium]